MIRKILVLLTSIGLVAAGLLFVPSISLRVGDSVELHQLTVKARDLSLVQVRIAQGKSPL